ncbi:MAG: 2-hydroxyacid dehydrogenase [Eubacteriales bacterium]|nr:2-hydroxyacid dehydrogenase [Eubacteriales bacterium]
MNIVLLESLGIPEEVLGAYVARLTENGHCFTAYERSTDEKELISRCKDADILMLANMPLSGNVIRACKNLKFIDVAFTGVDHVDLSAAREMKAALSNASGYSNESVAELTIGMAVDCFRHVEQVSHRCRTGGTKVGLVGRELRGHTVGVIGYGAIGSRAAELFHAFGCKVLAYSRHPKNDVPAYVTYVPLEKLLAESDVVTLHCPLTDETRGLMNAERISMMKPGAVLINTARGPVVDSAALADALRNERLSAAAVDVFEMEPPVPADHPLLSAPNCLLTPHVAFATAESMLLRAQIVFDNLDAFLNGGQQNAVIAR